jgi:hypothetical protein
MGRGVYRRTIVWWWGGNKVAHRIEKGKGGDTRARVGGSWVGGFFPSKIDGLVDWWIKHTSSTLFYLDLASTVSTPFDSSPSFPTLSSSEPADRNHAQRTRAPPSLRDQQRNLSTPRPLTLSSGSASETRRSRTYTILKGRSRTQTTALPITD